MGDNRKRRPLAEVEAELGRPCTHARTPREQWLKYCRKCSNIVSQRRQLERERASGTIVNYTQRRQVS
jgi:hypothetical protein